MKFLVRFLIGVFALFSTVSVHGQKYGDATFYLLDSLDLDELGEANKILLDTNLVKYHLAESDTERLAHLQFIVTECWNEKVWPIYNEIILRQVEKNLANYHDEAYINKNKYFLANAVSNVGLLYDQDGNILVALEWYLAALELHRELKSYKDMAATLNNIAVIYSVTNEYERSLEYHQQSFEARKKVNDTRGMGVTYINIGSTLENMGKPFEALEYYEKALEISLENGYTRNMAMSYEKIGNLYLEQELYVKALDYYQMALEQWTINDSYVGMASANNSIAEALQALDRGDEAIEYAEKGYSIAKELGFPVDIQHSSKTMSFVLRRKGEYKRALEFYDEYVEMREILRNEQTDKEVLRKSMAYEHERQALTDSLEFAKLQEVNELKIKTQQTENYALYGGVLLLIIILIIAIRSFIQKKKDNALINAQKIEVERQKNEIEEQHILLETHMQEISDSISYAQRIQNAILPSRDSLNENLGNGFVLYLPKDVVSGDFYWMETSGDDILFAAADCTGHGVPGAMVSVVCNNALKRCIHEYQLVNPKYILEKSRELVIDAFKDKEMTVKDGMDISLCRWNKKENIVEWAGANNPLYILRSDSEDIDIIPANKQPIGWYNVERPFDVHRLDLKKGDQIYLFTDGYADQFGGPKGKKLKHSRFQEEILRSRNWSMEDQQKHLEQYFYDWMGEIDQIDDVCVIGVRV